MQPRHARSARPTKLSAPTRHEHRRARRNATRSLQQPLAGDDQGGPLIVVGYDATPQARAAFSVAVRPAGPRGTVVAVHAVTPARSYLGRPYYDGVVERTHLDGRAILDDVPAADGSAVETALLEGRPAEVLARVACVRDAREIVVGSRRRGRVHAMLGSSVSRRLLATADRPIVVVPAPPAS